MASLFSANPHFTYCLASAVTILGKKSGQNLGVYFEIDSDWKEHNPVSNQVYRKITQAFPKNNENRKLHRDIDRWKSVLSATNYLVNQEGMSGFMFICILRLVGLHNTSVGMSDVAVVTSCFPEGMTYNFCWLIGLPQGQHWPVFFVCNHLPLG